MFIYDSSVLVKVASQDCIASLMKCARREGFRYQLELNCPLKDQFSMGSLGTKMRQSVNCCLA